MSPRKCPACGTEMPEKAHFCLNCGNVIDPVALSNGPAISEPAQRKRPRRWLRLVMVAVIVAVVVGGGSYIFSTADKDAKVGMGVVLVGGGFVGFIVAILMVVVRVIRKKRLKSWLLTGGACLWAIVMGGVAIVENVPDAENAASTPKATPAAPPVVSVPAETLEQILAKAANITSLRFNMVMMGVTETRATMYWKGSKTRLDFDVNGTSAVLLQFADSRTMIAYVPAEKRRERGEAMVGQDANSSGSPVHMAKDILKQKPDVLGSEILDGTDTMLVEGTGEDGQKYRAWIDKAHGMPVRVDTWTPQGKSIVELKNAEFYYLPDSLFEVPAGIQITDLPAKAPAASPTPSATAAPAPLPVTVPRLYVNPEFHYSIEVAAGWSIDDTQKSSLLFRSGDRGGVLQVFTYNSKSNLDSAVSNSDAGRSREQDYQEVSRQKSVLPGGLPAYLLDGRWRWKGAADQQRHLRVVAVKRNIEVEIVSTAPDATWETYRAQIESMANSLAIAD